MLPAYANFSFKFGTLLLLVISQSRSGETKYIFDNQDFLDVQDAMVAITDKVHDPGCVIVLLHDELLPSIADSASLMMALQKDMRRFITLNLSKDPSNAPTLHRLFGTNDTAEIIARYLHQLYRMNRCYTFLIWLKRLRALYPERAHRHPGWRYEDVVVFTAHHLSSNRYRNFTQYRFWKEIPNIVGLKRRVTLFSTLRNVYVFTVLPYYINGQSKSHELDAWECDQKKFEKNATLLSDKFTTLNRTPLNISILWKAPFIIYGDIENPYFDGLDWRLLKLAFKRLKFVIHFNPINGELSGNLRNGSWTGVLGEIERGMADLAVGGISVNSERRVDFGFCRTYYTDSYSFISPLNTTLINAWSDFVKPLSPVVWMMLVITALIVSISVKIIALLDQYMLLKILHQTNFPDLFFTRISNNLLHFLTIFCQRSFRHVPKSNALKWVYIGTSFPVTVLGIVFGGNLFGQLLQPNPDVSVDLIKEILPSNLQIDVRNYDGHLNDYVNKSRRKHLLRIWEKANYVQFFESFESMDEVVKGNRIYIDSKARMEFNARYKYQGASGSPKFHAATNDIIKSVNIAWPTRKNWPFRPKFDRIITAAVESGLVHYWMTHFRRGHFGWGGEAYKLNNKEKYPLEERERKNISGIDPTLDFALAKQVKPIRIKQLEGVNALYFTGMILSIFVFCVELAIGCSCMTGRILKLGICWLNRKIRDRRRVDSNQHELKTIQKELENSIKASPKPKKLKRRRRVRKHLVNGQDEGGFQGIVWSDFESTTKWATPVGDFPGLLSRRKAVKARNLHQ